MNKFEHIVLTMIMTFVASSALGGVCMVTYIILEKFPLLMVAVIPISIASYWYAKYVMEDINNDIN